jgi:hypothetical protein
MVNRRQRVNGKNRSVTKEQVRRMIRARKEKQILSLNSSGTSTTAGTVTYISQIAEGDSPDDRSGYQIRPVKHLVHLQVDNASTSMTRFIIVQDKIAYGSAPTVGQILSSALPTNTINPIAIMNGRYKILLDEMLTTSATGKNIEYKSVEIKMKGVIHFIGPTTSSSDAGNNAMFLLVISDTATAYTSHHQLTYTDA